MLVLALWLVFIVRRNTIQTIISQHNVNLFLYTVIKSGLVRWITMRCSLVNKVLRRIVTSNPSRLKATAACVLGLPQWMPRVWLVVWSPGRCSRARPQQMRHTEDQNQLRRIKAAGVESQKASCERSLLLLPPYEITQAIIFLPCGFIPSFFFLFSSPNLSGRRLDVYHTSTHGVALVRI